jgi:CubicO group peptidase (beta-lactamase class C family)
MLTLGHAISLIIPLVSYIVFQSAIKPPFMSTSCALTGFIDCPSFIPVHGYAADEYKEAYDIFINNFKQGLDIGAAMAVYVDGRKVIDVQAGWQDKEKKIEYTKDTLQMVFSSTKALVCLYLRGKEKNKLILLRYHRVLL